MQGQTQVPDASFAGRLPAHESHSQACHFRMLLCPNAFGTGHPVQSNEAKVQVWPARQVAVAGRAAGGDGIGADSAYLG